MAADISAFQSARRNFHAALLESGVLCMKAREDQDRGAADDFPSNADGNSPTSIAMAKAVLERLAAQERPRGRPTGQVTGGTFEQATRSYVQDTLSAPGANWPGTWNLDPDRRMIFRRGQSRHFAGLAGTGTKCTGTAVVPDSGYILAPDILVVREPEPNRVNNQDRISDKVAARQYNHGQPTNGHPTLCASISCLWTLRSGMVTYVKSEALNLMRYRKGERPRVAVVTGEPMPSRLASLALVTGDLDCVYHFALPELMKSIKALRLDDSLYMLKLLVQSRCLKDVSDLPLDLAV